MSEPLASIAQLSAFLGRDIAEDDASAALALEVASSTVRSYCGHSVSEEASETVRMDGTGTLLLLLPGAPVTAVEAVSVDGETLAAELWSWSASGFVLRTDGYNFPGRPGCIEVTYTHGYATVPAAIVGVTLSLAGRMLDGSAGVKQESIGGYSVTYANPTPTLQAAESMALDPFRVTR